MTAERWERIQSLFFAAADLDPAGRAAFLNAACPDDPSVPREVEELLRAEHRSGEDWEASLSDAIAAVAADLGDDAAAARAGEAIGPYRERVISLYESMDRPTDAARYRALRGN